MKLVQKSFDMTIMKRLSIISAVVLTWALYGAQAQYGEPNSTVSQLYPGDARMFVVSVGDQLTVLDLPSGRTSARISLPHPSTSLTLSEDHRYLVAFRSRTYPPEYMTVVRSGVLRNFTGDQDLPYSDSYELPAGPVSLVGLPLITRTIDVGDSIVPSHDEYLEYNPHYDCYMIAEEKRGAMLMFNASMLESTEAWRPQEWNMTTVDHYAVLPWGPHLYVGYASENKVKLYTRDMRVLEEHNCTGVHGHQAFQKGNTSVGAFGCTDGVLLVFGNGTSRMLPTATRVSSFIPGYNGNIFGVARDLTTLYHVDLAAPIPTATAVPSGGERRGHTTWSDKSLFAQIHTSSNLTVHNGTTGAVVAWTRLLPANIDTTAVPAMEVYKSRYIYITLPQHGLVVVAYLDLTATEPSQRIRVVDQLFVGGRPVRLLLAD